MARKPVKKRTQPKPRKSAKKSSFDKIVRKALAKKKVPTNPRFKLKIGVPDGDKFFVHPETIPDGVALQWASPDLPYHDPMLARCLASGWKLVPKQEAIGGLVLVWAPKAIADAQRDKNIDIAQQQMQEMRDLFKMDAPYVGQARRFPLVSESFLVSEPYQSIPSDTPPIDVEVTTRFRLSAHFQEAAALLHITPEVYAHRRLELYLRGELGGILLPMGGALELFEAEISTFRQGYNHGPFERHRQNA